MSSHQQAHVVGHDLQCHDLPVMRGRLLPDELIAAKTHRTSQNRAAVLRAPHHVVADVVYATRGSSHLTGHAAQYTHRVYLTGLATHLPPEGDNPLTRF